MVSQDLKHGVNYNFQRKIPSVKIKDFDSSPCIFKGSLKQKTATNYNLYEYELGFSLRRSCHRKVTDEV